MIKGKSLSDSSTSESEDDGNKAHMKSNHSNLHQERKKPKYLSAVETFNYPAGHQTADIQQMANNSSPLKRKVSTFDVEDSYGMKKAKHDFKTPMVSHEIDSSTSESEDEVNRRKLANAVSSSSDDNMKPTTRGKNSATVIRFGASEFKKPNNCRETESSTSESDDDFGKKLFGSSVGSESSGYGSQESSISFFGAQDNQEKETNSNNHNDIGRKLMQKMGWLAGKGLGKHGQGITEPIEASKQRGRRGLGLHIQGLEPADVTWDSEKEKETVEEIIVWMPECTEEPPSLSELRDWQKIGKKKLEIDDETNFCDPDILSSVLSCKSMFDELEPEEMRKARTRSNPFETIRGGIFLNRAAMKMANVDACFDFMFSEPKDKEGASIVEPDELLYFADVCAGPGGFSEYILYRKKWESKGFGFTLKGANDFKLDEFFSGPPETFEPHYGAEGDGNIYKPCNLREFRRFVLANTDNKGVHFVMADGGFSVEGQENIQEIMSKRLYLCQFLCALLIVRTGGHFFCKLFDLFTPFSVGLIYLMYRAFEKVCIHKPNTSRPANSERYIICKWRKENTKDICDYMFEVNDVLDRLCSVSTTDDVVEVVPLSILKEDEAFNEYIVNSNDAFGARQILHLNKIRAFARNGTLYDNQQSDFRKRCLAVWKIPDNVRQAPSRPEPNVRFKELLRADCNSLDSQPTPLTEDNLQELSNIFNFKCIVCGEIANNSYRGFFLSLGRSNIYRLDLKTSKWSKLDVQLELPADTLLYGELIAELKGEGKAQRRMMSLQVIDALFLGGRDVRTRHFTERMSLTSKMAKAVSKPSRSEYIPIKVKRIWDLDEINEILGSLVEKNVKGSGRYPRLCFDTKDDRHFIPSGLLIFDTVTAPWITAYSKSQQRVYFFNTKKNESTFHINTEAAANFKQMFSKRFFWNWEKGVQLLPHLPVEKVKSVVHSSHFRTFVSAKLKAFTGRA